MLTTIKVPVKNLKVITIMVLISSVSQCTLVAPDISAFIAALLSLLPKSRILNTNETTPTTSNFFLGGSITGLTQSGLVLSSGTTANQSLTVSSGASSFQFSNSENSGTAYNVTITTQPSGNVCTISNNSGTVTTNVGSVTISCTTINTLYVLNIQTQNITALTVNSNGTLSLLNTTPPEFLRICFYGIANIL